MAKVFYATDERSSSFRGVHVHINTPPELVTVQYCTVHVFCVHTMNEYYYVMPFVNRRFIFTWFISLVEGSYNKSDCSFQLRLRVCSKKIITQISKHNGWTTRARRVERMRWAHENVERTNEVNNDKAQYMNRAGTLTVSS